LDYQYTLLKNEGQKEKMGLFWGWVAGWAQERENESEYGRCVLHPYMKIEQ
jgi:hypothetical protein